MAGTHVDLLLNKKYTSLLKHLHDWQDWKESRNIKKYCYLLNIYVVEIIRMKKKATESDNIQWFEKTIPFIQHHQLGKYVWYNLPEEWASFGDWHGDCTCTHSYGFIKTKR